MFSITLQANYISQEATGPSVQTRACAEAGGGCRGNVMLVVRRVRTVWKKSWSKFIFFRLLAEGELLFQVELIT